MRGARIGRLRSAAAKIVGSAMVLLLAVPSLGHAYQRPAAVERVDIAGQGGSAAHRPLSVPLGMSLSNDGRLVAFSTDAALVAPDDVLHDDIYVRDMDRGTTELITQSPEGVPAVGVAPRLSYHPFISASGRYVAFTSDAVNLVPGDTNELRDVFVFDRKLKKMQLVSADSSGDPVMPGTNCGATSLFNCSWGPTMSANGRYISFTSLAPLVADDTNDAPDVFVFDRKTERTLRASVDSNEQQVHPCTAGLVAAVINSSPCPAADIYWGSSIDATGRYVAFDSLAPDLVEGDTNDTWDVFVRDLEKGTTERVSVASDGSETVDPQGTVGGTQNNHRTSSLNERSSSFGRSFISAGGRYVTFSSYASNLVPNDTNRLVTSVGTSGAGEDSFVHDRQTGRTERVSVTAFGGEIGHRSMRAPLGGNANTYAIDSSGRFVLFQDPGLDDKGSLWGPFVHDRLTGARIPIAGAMGVDGVADVNLSGSGRFVAFGKSGERDPAEPVTFPRTRWRTDLGPLLGIGGFGGSPSEPDEGDDRICVNGICIPPGVPLSSSDATDDLNEVLTEQGTNLYGASVAHRPEFQDLFVTIELEHMPHVIPGPSPIFYGLHFGVEGRSYEVRAASLLGGTFGLFDCTDLCTRVADLRGGYGTTGMRVVLSLPLAAIGLEESGELSDVDAFSAVGSYMTGATKVIDRVRLN